MTVQQDEEVEVTVDVGARTQDPPAAEREAAVTEQVVASFADAPPRLREVMQSLVQHLHGFARDVRLTQEEWEQAVGFLTRAGHITDDERQEFILLSDVLGLSMQTIGINAPSVPGATESTVFGPFFVEGAPEIALGGDVAGRAPGEPCWVSGTVRSDDGTPLPDVRVDVWEADEDGMYDVQYDGGRDTESSGAGPSEDYVAGRAWLRTGPDGEYRFWAVRPSPYSIPADGPVGQLLRTSGRGTMRPAHLHFKVAVPGHRTLVTHLFLADDPHLGTDAVFGVKDSLVVDVTEHDGGTAPDGSPREGAWCSIAFDLVLARETPSTETVTAR